jgi:hypothetical protein
MPESNKRVRVPKTTPLEFKCTNKVASRAIGRVLYLARQRKRSAKAREDDPVKVSESKKRAYNKKPEKYNERSRANYALNTEVILEQQRGYKDDHKDEIRTQMSDYLRRRMERDPDFRMRRRCQARLASFLKQNDAEKQISTMQAVGCTCTELSVHLTRQLLTDDVYIECQIDHIFPCALYEVGQEAMMMNYSNLQPLLPHENHEKRAKLPTKAMAAKVDPACWPDGITMDMLPDIYPGWRTPLRM